MRTLYVVKITPEQLAKSWGTVTSILTVYRYEKFIYPQCNVEGIVNWAKTNVYTAHELVERKVVIKELKK